ncbi:chromosome partitioning protein ParA, partial [Vibrio parahaemolyticus]
YQGLQQQYQSLATDKTQLVASVKSREASLDSEVDKKLEAEIALRQKEHQAELEKLQNQLTEMEKLNITLEGQIKSQKAQIETTQNENDKLSRQADMQNNMFERSRELFRREMEISQELDALQKEREVLVPKLETLKKACEVYLSGKSW